MLASFYSLVIFLFQPDAVSATPVESAPGTGTGGGAGGCAGGGPQELLMLLAMFALFYFLLIRPQQKQARERDQMLKAIQKGSSVRTSGGIRGEVLSIDEDEITLLVAPKVKLQVLRANVAAILGAEGKNGSGDAPKKDKAAKKDKDGGSAGGAGDE